MKKGFVIILFCLTTLAAAFYFAKYQFSKNNPAVPQENAPSLPPVSQDLQNFSGNQTESSNPGASEKQSVRPLQPPLDRSAERVTKKPFGIFITPQNSPVQPEKFRGYHTGTDFEIFPEEVDADVNVYAICSGTIALKESASGYGGVLVQNCQLDNQPITAIYGHLKLASISKKTSENLNAGETIGILGKAYSLETDGERKHLHLGIHRGSSISIRGYAGSQAQLSGWIDPCSHICN
ncbi:MAG: hypothetical protein A3J76_04810 [Candidatus Moranbacteria bacterium RBG_13_45_13]|nr:MAG: hypothetical protein A3J76_04810 [Candidatus Moranbacteria bacterium RBG_13_45_13]